MALVLVVDDDPVSRLLLKHLITNEGHETVEVVGGREALALLGHRSVGLVLSDHQMPGMTGVELRRSLGPTFAVPFVLLSGHERADEIGDASELEAAGVSEILVKPISSSALRAALARWLPANV